MLGSISFLWVAAVHVVDWTSLILHANPDAKGVSILQIEGKLKQSKERGE